MDHGSIDGDVQVNERLNLGDLGNQGNGANSRSLYNVAVSDRVIVIRPKILSNLDNLADQGFNESLNSSSERGLPEAVIVIRSGNAEDLAHQMVNTGSSSNSGEQCVVRSPFSITQENLASVGAEDGERDSFGKRKGLAEEQKVNFAKDKDEKRSFISNHKCGEGDNWDGEKLCRICHLSSDQTSEASPGIEVVLIQLGCGCKGELCVAHRHCAEAWFKLKGNRVCEICGETAQNVTGVGDGGFIEDWNARGSNGNQTNAPERVSACWSGQPLCNLLLACLVITFVLPWFFHVNML
ncbi:hypothetical protein Ancab_005438 [Ancistrocladus abbreviatus]